MSRRVLVTGASRGAGKGIAIGLGEKGMTVFVTGRSVDHSDAIGWDGKPLAGTIHETAAAVTILVATWLKTPVSTTHVISSSIMGVGASKRVSAVRWGVAQNMLVAWLLTLPVSAAVAALTYLVLHQFLA